MSWITELDLLSVHIHPAGDIYCKRIWWERRRQKQGQTKVTFKCLGAVAHAVVRRATTLKHLRIKLALHLHTDSVRILFIRPSILHNAALYDCTRASPTSSLCFLLMHQWEWYTCSTFTPIIHVQRWAIRRALGCVNPASLWPRGASSHNLGPTL